MLLACLRCAPLPSARVTSLIVWSPQQMHIPTPAFAITHYIDLVLQVHRCR